MLIDYPGAEMNASNERERITIHGGKRLRTRPLVSVIIPTLNEASNLPLILPYLPMQWIDEVLLVDGRSTDNTIEVAKQIIPTIKPNHQVDLITKLKE